MLSVTPPLLLGKIKGFSYFGKVKICYKLRILFSSMVMVITGVVHAQHNVQLHNLWSRPQVHVVFGDYTVSFTIRDINKALSLLRATGDSLTAATCGLDTAKDYFYELQPGTHTEYHDTMQPILQNTVGVFLLSRGHAFVTLHKKVLKDVIMDPGIPGLGEPAIFATFYDPKSRAVLFAGKAPVNLLPQDLGIDDD